MSVTNLHKASYRALNTAVLLQTKHCSPSNVNAIPCHTKITKKNKQKLKIIDTYSLGILYNSIIIIMMIAFPG